MTVFIRAVATVSRLCGIVAALLIAVSVLVVSHMVAARYIFGAPTIWQTEFVTYALIGATLIGSPYVALHRGHVNMDVVALYAGPRTRFWLALVAYAGALAFCLLLAIQGAWLWSEAWARNWHSETVWRVPLWIPYAALPLGMGILSLQYVADLIGLLTGRDQPFGLPEGTGGEPPAASSLHAEAR